MDASQGDEGLDCVPELVVCSSQVYQFNVPTFGPGVVFDVDYSVRMEQYRFFTEALTVKRLKSYVEMMVEEAEVRACVCVFLILNNLIFNSFFLSFLPQLFTFVGAPLVCTVVLYGRLQPAFVLRPCVSEDEKVVDLCHHPQHGSL